MHVFEVLSDPVRRRILELLGAGEMASGEVVEAIGAEFGITQAAVSQHLKVLRESGFARVRADAQRRLYWWMPPDFRRWTHGSASSGVFGSRSWMRWQRRSRAASASGATRRYPNVRARERRHRSDRTGDTGNMVDDKNVWAGQCHCGAVRFEATLSDGFNSILRCTCSYCRMRGAVVAMAEMGGIKILQGEDALTSDRLRYRRGAALLLLPLRRFISIINGDRRRIPMPSTWPAWTG